MVFVIADYSSSIYDRNRTVIYEKFTELTDDRIIASLIGMPKAKFTALAKDFESAHSEIDRERVLNGEIKRV